MVLDLLLIALAITLDPLPLMAFVLVVASTGGARKGLVFLLSWLACLVTVIAVVLLLTDGQPPPPRSPPSTAALGAKLAVGVSLLGYGEHRRRRLAAVRARGGSGPGPRAAPRPAGRGRGEHGVWGRAPHPAPTRQVVELLGEFG
ncbi:GAP family protein, partial [Streptomyces sp. IBSBF 3136]|uniref:GAP family protein n=1 Tax=Streptomyces sp. IBSBF 3136 TaxID=2903524 RepID=UPI002FDC007A